MPRHLKPEMKLQIVNDRTLGVAEKLQASSGPLKIPIFKWSSLPRLPETNKENWELEINSCFQNKLFKV